MTGPFMHNLKKAGSFLTFCVLKGKKMEKGFFKSPCNTDHFRDSKQIKLGCFGSRAGCHQRKTNFIKSTLLQDTAQCVPKGKDTALYRGNNHSLLAGTAGEGPRQAAAPLLLRRLSLHRAAASC